MRTRLRRDDGSAVEADLLRGPQWMAEHHPAVGGSVWLDLPEMAAVGSAEVLAVEPCPAIEEGGPGARVVTAVFRHTAGEVWELRLADGGGTVAGTGGHPFWSLDRRRWVPLRGLRVGEALQSLTGPVLVESLNEDPTPEPVYSIKVEGDHCYCSDGLFCGGL